MATLQFLTHYLSNPLFVMRSIRNPGYLSRLAESRRASVATKLLLAASIVYIIGLIRFRGLQLHLGA